jgi:hypothetical protein
MEETCQEGLAFSAHNPGTRLPPVDKNLENFPAEQTLTLRENFRLEQR